MADVANQEQGPKIYSVSYGLATAGFGAIVGYVTHASTKGDWNFQANAGQALLFAVVSTIGAGVIYGTTKVATKYVAPAVAATIMIPGRILAKTVGPKPALTFAQSKSVAADIADNSVVPLVEYGIGYPLAALAAVPMTLVKKSQNKKLIPPVATPFGPTFKSSFGIAMQNMGNVSKKLILDPVVAVAAYPVKGTSWCYSKYVRRAHFKGPVQTFKDVKNSPIHNHAVFNTLLKIGAVALINFGMVRIATTDYVSPNNNSPAPQKQTDPMNNPWIKDPLASPRSDAGKNVVPVAAMISKNSPSRS